MFGSTPQVTAMAHYLMAEDRALAGQNADQITAGALNFEVAA